METAELSYPEVLSRCIEVCRRCHGVCLAHAKRLIESVPDLHDGQILSALVRTIGASRLVVDMVLTESGSHQEACMLCSITSTECAELCATEPGMQDCVDACLACAEQCQKATE